VKAFRCCACSLAILVALLLTPGTSFGQKRLMEQDSTLNNLVHLPGAKTIPLGELGDWKKTGNGPRIMLIIPGAGFGGQIFDEFAERWGSDYTIYTVSLAGFGGTAAPVMPPEGTSFGEQTWTTGALNGIKQLIEQEGLRDITVVGHWLVGTQVAVRLALEHPEIVRSLIILSGSARYVSNDTAQMRIQIPLEKRVDAIDNRMVPKWFKTVTRATWDDNNFLPQDYAINPFRQLQLWRMAEQPTLPVWVRYLNEFYAQDTYLDLPKLKVPVLIIKPGMDDDCYVDGPGFNYMWFYCVASWEGAEDQNPLIHAVTIHNTRLSIQDDQPEELDRTIRNFLEHL